MANDKWNNPQKMWDERFAQAEPVYGEHPNAYLCAQAHRLTPGCKILVPGDGYGRNGIWLARQGFRVTTVDLSPIGVERARKSAQAAGLTMSIEEADLAAWNWPVGEFDAVASIFLHLPPDLRPQIHAQMLGALKRGGLLILEAFTPAQLQHSSGGPKQLELLYTTEILQKDFAATEALELLEVKTDLDEGRMHRGRAAVVHGVFRKR
ncbi:MAG TPA: class I SAM-dependent methyltransferase [Candidatus Acidoferrum sp.]|nr:class I SAM-dependent methyltransferase [Candidatus Acidoferrum sp.]